MAHQTHLKTAEDNNAHLFPHVALFSTPLLQMFLTPQRSRMLEK
jgi:hypothetical protein